MRLSVILVIASASLAGGCASIVSGTSQVVSVETHQSSTPVPGASCEMVNSKGTYHVTTPGTITINRAYGDLSVNCTKEGMPDGVATVISSTKGMVFGNALFGGLIGVAVDTGSGAAYDYPEVIRILMGESIAIKGNDTSPDGGSTALASAPPAGSATTVAAAKVGPTVAPTTQVAAPAAAPAANAAAPTAASGQTPVSINDLRYLLPTR